MNTQFKLIGQTMPDFISYETPARPRQEGFTPGANQIAIEELTEAQALEYAEEMKNDFFKHWADKVAEKISQSTK